MLGFLLTSLVAICLSGVPGQPRLVASPLAAPQQVPVFRSGVEVVTVDVVVLDKNGRPVPGLQPADFVVTVGKRVRRLVAADYFSTSSRPTQAAVGVDPRGALAPGTGTATPAGGRTFIFVVDVDEIRAGEGRIALRNVADYLDRLDADDRVGLVSLPSGRPRVEPTSDRVAIRHALGMIVGTSNRIREPQMTPGEAAGIARRDGRALLAWWQRGMETNRCRRPPQRPLEEAREVPAACQIEAEGALQQHRLHTRIMMDSLAALVTGMAPLSGQKTLVLVSEGLFNDPQSQGDVDRFAAAAERAGVTLYAVHLDAPRMEAAAGPNNITMTRALDDRVGFDGMAEVAVAARGTAFRVVAQATAVLERIDTELSGYYLLFFERDANDREGRRERIEVKVNRPGLEVRARREFTPGPGRVTATLRAWTASSDARLRRIRGLRTRWCLGRRPEAPRTRTATWMSPWPSGPANARVCSRSASSSAGLNRRQAGPFTW